MTDPARITYYLSESGRRDSLRRGGDGKRQQVHSGIVAAPDLDIFAVDDEGGISFDGTTAPTTFEPDDKHHWMKMAGKEIGAVQIEVLWDVVPTWDDLLRFARWAHDLQKKEDDERYLDWEAQEAEKDRITYAFLADPNARAEKISEDYVTIGGHDFWSTSGRAFVEAHARSARDHEELKKANRETLAAWIGRHGTENQRQRLAADLLPWKEVYDAVEKHVFAPLADFPLYERFEIKKVCECVQAGAEKPCKVKFQSIDATELTADEWEQFARIRSAVPQATLHLREHRAQCQIAFDPEIKRGVIVKVSLDRLTFKREFALTGANQ